MSPTTWTSLETGTRIREAGGEPDRAQPSKPTVMAAALVVGVDVEEALVLAGFESGLTDPAAPPEPRGAPEPAGWLELKVIRERDGWELGKLADAAGLHRETLRLYENGQRNPSPSSIRALAGVLRVPYSVLEPSPRSSDVLAVAEQPSQPRRSSAHMSGHEAGRRHARMSGHEHGKEPAAPAMPEPRVAGRS